MNFLWFLVAVFFVALVVLALVGSAAERKEVAAMPPAARQRYLQNKEAEKQRSLANEQESMRTKQHG